MNLENIYGILIYLFIEPNPYQTILILDSRSTATLTSGKSARPAAQVALFPFELSKRRRRVCVLFSAAFV